MEMEEVEAVRYRNKEKKKKVHEYMLNSFD
jgi:hypothetical protein